MRTFKHVMAMGALCLSAFSPALYAQTDGLNRKEWQQQMKLEEQKIAAFVKEQMKNTGLNESLKQAFLSAPRPEEEVKESALPRMAENYLEQHYRQVYFEQHPEATKVYNPGRVAAPVDNKLAGAAGTNMLCNYGDFESATISNLSAQGYTGYAGPGYNYATGGVCNFVPTTNVAYTNIGFGNPDDFIVTNNAPDPNVPALRQTHNGSQHAIRINGYTRCDQFGINMLQKSFTSSVTGKGRINFSYALVLQGPHTGSDADGNSFFVARILDNNGTEVGSRICVPGHATGTGFQSVGLPDCRRTPNYQAHTLWRDWACDFIEFEAQAGKTYTIEFFVAGCKWNVHYGYAYVDDICADVTCCNTPPAPQNPKCTSTGNGSKLSWDPVPGAVSYKVSLVKYDPDCCPGSKEYFLVTIWNTSSTSINVPNTFAYCFSWRVAAVMPDGCTTPRTDKQCSCTPIPVPTGLKCSGVTDSSILSWDAVPGAIAYKVITTKSDPACCGGNTLYFSNQWNVTGNTISIPAATFANCFSWYVIAIMPYGLQSGNSVTKCSCTPLIPSPANLGCVTNADGGSTLSWDPVAGAVYYEVAMISGDPDCCPNSTLAIFMNRNVTGTSTDVHNAQTACFSWTVTAVMPDSSRTDRATRRCSCSLPVVPKPAGTVGVPGDGNVNVTGNELLVTAVPNPASEYIQFTVQDKNSLNTDGKLSLFFYDVNGKEIVRKDIEGRQLRLDIRTYTNGVYIYEIRNKTRTLYHNKVIIEKH